MYSIDEIMDMLDWNQPPAVQEKGRQLAKNIRYINVFLQPLGKNLWDNCAIILSERSDEELRPYLSDLLEWILDRNWPGASCIWGRLKQYADNEWFNYMMSESIREATALQEEGWLNNLLELAEERQADQRAVL